MHLAVCYMCGPEHACGCGQDRCWHEYPERGWIQFLILRIVYDEPTYGYKLKETLEKKSSGLHSLETGSIYTLLRRMEHRGLLESEWKTAEASGPDRRVYKVTRKGAEALRTGLESIARRKALMDDLNEFYARHFMKTGEGDEKPDV